MLYDPLADLRRRNLVSSPLDDIDLSDPETQKNVVAIGKVMTGIFFSLLFFNIVWNAIFNLFFPWQPPLPTPPIVSMEPSRSQLERLGSQWQVIEDGWTGFWTRRGDSNIFDAVWKKDELVVTAVLTIEIEGDSVFVERRQASDGNDCNYVAVLPENGSREIQGRYQCNRINQGDGVWRARILR